MNVSVSSNPSSALALLAVATLALSSCSSTEYHNTAPSGDALVTAPVSIRLDRADVSSDAATPPALLSSVAVGSNSSEAAPLHLPALQDRDRTNQPWEVTLGGAGSNDEDFDSGGAQAAIGVGYYFNEVVALSLRQNGSYVDLGEGSPEAWNGISRIALDLHFPIEKFVPYVGGNFGYAYGDSVNETFLAGPEAGLKVYVKDDVFVQLGAEYLFFFEDSDRISDAFEDGQFVYGLNFGVRF